MFSSLQVPRAFPSSSDRGMVVALSLYKPLHCNGLSGHFTELHAFVESEGRRCCPAY